MTMSSNHVKCFSDLMDTMVTLNNKQYGSDLHLN